MHDQEHKLSIEEWVNFVRSETHDGKALSAMRCMHLVSGSPVEEVHGMSVNAGRAWDSKDAARTFKKKIDMFVQGRDGVRIFQFQAFFADQEPRCLMHYDKVGSMSWGDGVTEGPDGTGPARQVMRHTENSHQASMGMIRFLFQEMRADKQETRAEMRDLREQVRDSWTIIQDMMKRQLEAEHTHRMEELQFQRSTMERQKLMTALPFILNGVFGARVIPDAMAEESLFELASLHLSAMPERERAEAYSKLASVLPAEATAIVLRKLKTAGATAEVKQDGKALLSEGRKADRARDEDDLLGGVPELPALPNGGIQ